MLKIEDLKFDDLGDSASAYDPGDEAVVVVTAGEEGYRSEDTDETIITFAVRSQTGSIVQFRRTSSTWNDIFNEGRYMTPFKLPEAAGKYQIALYFDGRLVSESIFSINETEQSGQTEEDAGDEG